MVLLFLLISVLLVSKLSVLLEKGIDLFKKLKHDSHEFIMPSNSNIFFMPDTRSMFLCISDTNVKICYGHVYLSQVV